MTHPGILLECILPFLSGPRHSQHRHVAVRCMCVSGCVYEGRTCSCMLTIRPMYHRNQQLNEITIIALYMYQVMNYFEETKLYLQHHVSYSTISGRRQIQQNKRVVDLVIARPPHQPPVILSGTPELGLTPLTCVCWQINSILANIGHRNSIRILNQYPFWWNILIWA